VRLNDVTLLGTANVSDSKDNASGSVKTGNTTDDLQLIDDDIPF